jgi:hypothetical protein
LALVILERRAWIMSRILKLVQSKWNPLSLNVQQRFRRNVRQIGDKLSRLFPIQK